MEINDLKVGDLVVLENGDEVNLKCCYNITMKIEEIIVTEGVYKAECRWFNSKNKEFRNIFNFTSLESTY